MTTYDDAIDYLTNVIEFGTNEYNYISQTSIARRQSVSDVVRELFGVVENLRTLKVVLPSGDTTGATDYANIQDAINQESARSGRQSTVFAVPGIYYFDTGFVIGDRADKNQPGCSLHCIGPHADFNYTGGVSSRYAFEFCSAYDKSPTPRLKNIYLNGNGSIRGLLMLYQTYFTGVESVQIYNCREVGCDWVSSYKTRCKDLHVWYTDGIPMRVWRSQGTVFDSLRLASSRPQEFPDVEDESIVDDAGAFVRTTEAQRAVLHHNSREIVYRSMMYESNDFIDLPLAYISYYSRGVRFTEQLYLENNDVRNEKILISGASVPASGTKQFKFENILMADDAGSECFLRLKGYTSDIIVEHMHGDNINHVVVADGGVHRQISLVGIGNSIEPENAIAAVNGGRFTNIEQPYSEGMSLVSATGLSAEIQGIPGSYRITEEWGSLVVQRYEESDGGTGTGTSLDWVTKATLATP